VVSFRVLFAPFLAKLGVSLLLIKPPLNGMGWFIRRPQSSKAIWLTSSGNSGAAHKSAS
jgi:hypothetical protein